MDPASPFHPDHALFLAERRARAWADQHMQHIVNDEYTEDQPSRAPVVFDDGGPDE